MQQSPRSSGAGVRAAAPDARFTDIARGAGHRILAPGGTMPSRHDRSPAANQSLFSLGDALTRIHVKKRRLERE